MDFEGWKKQLIDDLQEKIKNNQINYDDFKSAVDVYNGLAFDLEKVLEFAARNSAGGNKEKMWKLYYDFSIKNVAEMCDKLNKLGYAIRNDKNCKNIVSTLNDQSFRIIEKTRHVLRSEVEYMIMRIFVANKKEIPPLLSKAFNPVYPDEIFKVFIYSFLSGILGETKEGGEL